MPSSRHRALAVLAVVALAVVLTVPAAPSPSAAAEPGGSDQEPWSAGSGSVGDSVDRVGLVVRPAAGGGRRAATTASQSASVALADAAGTTVEQRHERSGVATVSVPADRVDEAIARLEAQPEIDEVSVDPPVSPFGTVDATALLDGGPDDPLYPDQGALDHVDAAGAWETTTGAEAVRIAVLDTGVDADHEDLAVADGVNVSGEGAADDHDDVHGHGTHVAGIATARTDNTTGMAGMCWTCSILSVKVLTDSGTGTQSNVAEGIRWAIDADADVIVMSLGGEGVSTTLADAVAEAENAGVLMVAAAGNSGTDEERHPAAFDEVIGVAAVDGNDERTSFSNYGNWVEMAAPGLRIDSTISDPNAMGCSMEYCARSGTSMAAPHVAGTAALARAADGSASAAEIRAALVDNAVDVGGWLGGGRLDAAATVAAFDGGSDDTTDDGTTDDGTTDDGTTDDGTTDDGSTDDGTTDDGGDSTDDGGTDDGTTDDGGDGTDDGGTDDGGTDDGGTDDGGTDDGTGSSLEDGVTRTAGSQRFATAATLSAETFDPGVDRAYLATATAFADALAAGAAAGAADGPVLLAAGDTLPTATRDELARLAPGEVVVVGGDGALSEDVARAAGNAAGARVRRVAGNERFATAAALARDAFTSGVDTAYVATGTAFADALAGVPAAISDNAPMLLTARGQLPAATREALVELDPAEIVVLGGTSAVSSDVAQQLGELAGAGGVTRLAGSDRFTTAAAIAERFEQAPAGFVATGFDYPDALAGGPVAGYYDSPLLLAAGDDLPDATRAQLERLAPTHLRLLGGSSVLGDELFDGLLTLLDSFS